MIRRRHATLLTSLVGAGFLLALLSLGSGDTPTTLGACDSLQDECDSHRLSGQLAATIAIVESTVSGTDSCIGNEARGNRATTANEWWFALPRKPKGWFRQVITHPETLCKVRSWVRCVDLNPDDISLSPTQLLELSSRVRGWMPELKRLSNEIQEQDNQKLLKLRSTIGNARHLHGNRSEHEAGDNLRDSEVEASTNRFKLINMLRDNRHSSTLQASTTKSNPSNRVGDSVSDTSADKSMRLAAGNCIVMIMGYFQIWSVCSGKDSIAAIERYWQLLGLL